MAMREQIEAVTGRTKDACEDDREEVFIRDAARSKNDLLSSTKWNF